MPAKPDRLSEQEYVRWNDEMVRRYDIDKYYEDSHRIVRWIEHQRIAALVRLAAARPGDRVLEVGCGGGHVLEHFAEARRTGVDLSRDMLARSRSRLGRTVSLARGAAEALPFPDGSYDVVLCTEVLEHTREPAAVSAELMRVVRVGGRVVVSIPNERNIDRVKRALGSLPVLRRVLRTLAEEANEWHLHSFDMRMLRDITVGYATIEKVAGVPLRGIAVRYVALLRPLRSTGA